MWLGERRHLSLWDDAAKAGCSALSGSRPIRWLQGTPAGHQVENKRDDEEDDKDVDPAAEGIAADEAYEPAKKEDDGDCPKHGGSPVDGRTFRRARAGREACMWYVAGCRGQVVLTVTFGRVCWCGGEQYDF